ncbi:hypothetical protein RB595_005816 [Gaeumannomyces hyphopodioides]
MRDSRAVCLLCRSVAAGRRPLLVPWPRARAAAAAALVSSVASSESATPVAADRNDGARTSRSPPLPGAPTTAPGRPSPDRSAASLAIFESVVRGKSDQTAGPPGVATDLGLRTFDELVELSHVLNMPDVPLARQYRQFRDSIYPRLYDSGVTPELFKTQISHLLQMVSTAIAQDPSDRELPSLAEYTQMARKLKMLNLKHWVTAVRGVLAFVCSVDPSPNRYDRLESYELALGRRNFALESLVDSWKLFSLPEELLAPLPRLGDVENVKFAVPTLSNKALSNNEPREVLRLALSEFFPHMSPADIAPAIPFLLATFIVINDKAICPLNIRAAATPLLAPIASLLARVTARLMHGSHEEAMLQNLTDIPDELADYLTRRWPAVIDQLTGTSRSTFGREGDTQFSKMDLSGANRKPVSTINRELQTANHKKDVAAIEAVWYDFWGDKPQPDKETCSFLRANVSIFHQFITMYTAQGFPQRSVQVWNAMTSIGIKPDVRTFTAMMDGFKRARSLRGVQNTWDKLVATGLQLDVRAWTARVDGLTHCGKPEDGLRALEEMAVRWKAIEAGRKNNASHMAVKPSIEPVNAALVGLLRLNGIAAARKLLVWAQRHDITPDIATYNTLLRTLIREGPQGAEAVINMMRQQGLNPDDVTVTIVLEALVPTIFDKEGHEEKIQVVRRILNIIGKISTAKNQHAYSKLLYLILKAGGRNADQVVNHVAAHIFDDPTQKPNAFAYTILAQHYLSRDPPDVHLVRSLIDNHRLFNNPAIDYVFWERVINGYLSVDDVDGALGVLSNMRTSTSLTLTVLERLLIALVRERRVPEADALVKRVKDERLALAEDSDLKGRFLNHSFFEFATECGLHGSDPR